MCATFRALGSQLMDHYEFHDEQTKKRLVGISFKSSHYLGPLQYTHLMYASTIPDKSSFESGHSDWDVDYQRNHQPHTVVVLEFLDRHEVIFDPSCAQFLFFPDWQESAPRYPYYFSSATSDQSKSPYFVSQVNCPTYGLDELENYLIELKSTCDTSAICRIRTIEHYIDLHKRVPRLVAQLLRDNL